ncbi:MAG TPA: WD40 repeat domain-containing protein [Pirellulales bacterium]|nr:WD40 repeat domain-containing protein [Pirellulales bacterium]
MAGCWRCLGFLLGVCAARGAFAAPPVDLAGDPLPAGAVLRLGTTRFHQDGQIRSLAISPDGTEIAGGSDGAIIFWDAATGRVLRRQLSTSAGMWMWQSVSYSPDGRWIAACGRPSGNGETGLALFETASGKSGPQLAVNSRLEMTHVVFSPDGAMIAAGASDRTVRLFSAISGEELKILQSPVMQGRREANCLAFSPDGKFLAAGSDSGEVRIWDLAIVEEPLILRLAEGANNDVESLIFSPDNNRLLAASYEYDSASAQHLGHIRCFNPATGVVQAVGLDGYRPLPGNIKLVLSSDQRRLAAVRYDRIEVWDFASGKRLMTTDDYKSGFLHWPQPAVFSPDGRILYVIDGHQQFVRRWEVATGKELLDLPESHASRIEKLSFSEDGKRIATSSEDQTTRLWDATTGRPLRKLPGVMAALSPDGELTATSRAWKFVTPDGVVRLVASNSGDEVAQFDTGGDWIGPGVFSHDGKLLAVASYDRNDDQLGPIFGACKNQTIHVWDIAQRKIRLRMLADDSLFKELNFSDDDQKLYSVSEDASVALWNLATGKQESAELIKTRARSRLLTSAFSPHGDLLAYTLSASDGQTSNLHFGIWDLARHRTFAEPPELPSVRYQQCLALSPDRRGLALAAASWDSNSQPAHVVLLWDLTRQRERSRLQTGEMRVSSLEFSPDGRRLAAGMQDGTALVWDLDSLEGGDDVR